MANKTTNTTNTSTEAKSENKENPVVALLETIRGLVGKSDIAKFRKKNPQALAYDADGNPCAPNSDKATGYTLGGAMQRAVYERNGDSTGIDTVQALLGVGGLGPAAVAGLDGLERKTLDRRFDKALAAAKGEAYVEPDDDDDGEASTGREDSEAAEDAKPTL